MRENSPTSPASFDPLSSPAGRDGRGRFSAGNRGGPGNPLAGQVAKLRAAMLEAVTEDDMRAIIATLIEQAKSGNIAAIKELFERTLGKPQEADLLERLETLETALDERSGR